MSAKIERAYKNDSSGSVVVGEEIKYEIDFKTMTEKCLDPSENETMKVYSMYNEGRPKPGNISKTTTYIRSKLADEQ
jgi:hypothetical protein